MNTDMSRRQFVGLAGSLATVLGLGLVGCGGGAGKGSAAGSAAAKDVKGAAESKKLVVGFDKSYPPYGFVGDDGEYTGFDLDLAKAVADKQGWEVKYEAIDWDAKDALLNSGAINCIWNGFTMNGREDDYTWTPAYINNTQVFAVNKNSGIKKAADLAGKNVLVQADSSALAALQDEENTDIKALADSFGSLTQVPDYESALMELEAGSADAVAMDEGVALTKQAQNDNIVILDDVISQEQYGIAFKKGNDELRDQVWSTLLEMEKDGTVDKIAAKYPSINTANICISDNE